MRDRRDEPRHAARERVELSWNDAAGAEQSMSGMLRDVSRSGASLRLDRPIPINVKVRVTIRGNALIGTVKSCVRIGPQCQAGVEFDPEFHGTASHRTGDA
jgi:hypothetical protein